MLCENRNVRSVPRVNRIKKVVITQFILPNGQENHDVTADVLPSKIAQDNTDAQGFNEIVTQNLGVLLIKMVAYGAHVLEIDITRY